MLSETRESKSFNGRDTMSGKKKFIIITRTIIALSALTVGGVLLNNHVQLENYKKEKLNLPENFTYTAHTGCVGTADNSLESIEAAVRNGADVVEFDLNFTSDGEPVLAHDAPKGDEVTLDEAFEMVSRYEGLQVNIDIKSTQALDKVKPLAVKHGVADRIFYTGVAEEFLEAVKADCDGVPYYLNVDVKDNTDEEYIFSLVEKVKNSGAVGINFKKNNASKKLVDAFHENGLLVSVWTADSTRDIYRLLVMSPDNITTRRPDTMAEILQQRNV